MTPVHQRRTEKKTQKAQRIAKGAKEIRIHSMALGGDPTAE
jgi:hypothetical protein